MKLYKIFNLIALIHFGSHGEIKASSEGLLPPTPENQTITYQLERRIGVVRKRPFSTPCSTNETESFVIRARNGLIDRRFRWRDFNVFMDPSLNWRERSRVNNRMDRLERVLPCVNFRSYGVNVTPSGDYVHIVKKPGCWSYVGKLGGRQELSLGRGCWGMDTILHELIHALGFIHEHSRPDRDDHVTIQWGNIKPGREHAFRKADSSSYYTFGVAYNLQSIMHYNPYVFSVNNWQPTITTTSGETYESGTGLQQTDIQKLKRMYNC